MVKSVKKMDRVTEGTHVKKEDPKKSTLKNKEGSSDDDDSSKDENPQKTSPVKKEEPLCFKSE